MIYIFCFTMDEHRAFCTENYIRQGNPEYVYLERSQDLRGVSNPVIGFYGSPQKRRDFFEIKRMIVNRGGVVFKVIYLWTF